MKVIFLEDIPNVANAGETREVADGYGRNYLLPKKLAVLANSQGASVLESQMKKIAQKRAQAKEEMAEVAGKLNGMDVTIKAKVGEKERLYGSITSADIADELNRCAGLDIDKRKIMLEEPIRELGDYEVTVSFTQDIAAVIKLAVVADKVVEEKEEKKEVKKRKPRAEKKSEEPEGKVEETEAKIEESKDKVDKPEVKIEESEEKTEETEDKVEETEAKIEKSEEKTEETEDKVEEKESE